MLHGSLDILGHFYLDRPGKYEVCCICCILFGYGRCLGASITSTRLGNEGPSFVETHYEGGFELPA